MTALYKVVLAKQVRKKDLLKVPNNRRVKIVEVIGSLQANPKPKPAIKLTDREEYRLRVGVYRILYLISDENKTVYIRKVAHRGEAYR